MFHPTRRDFLKSSLAAGLAAGPLASQLAMAANAPGSKMKLGLVTYLWGQDWDLPTLIGNCEKTGILGVETRVEHAHGVEPSLNIKERIEVKKRFADSPVELLGPGTNQSFDSPDPTALAKSIEGAKAYVKLSHDCGGSGVKVKPNSFQKNVPHEVTIEQIGKSLNTLGAFGAEYGQEIRLEVHGSCCELPTIKRIMDIADHKNATVCWNCNGQDLEGEGLEYNFNLVKDCFGATAHVRELNVGDYPYQQLMDLFVGMDYEGWISLECRTKPADRVAGLIEQKAVFEAMIADAQARL